jgi:hypothetical protein
MNNYEENIDLKIHNHYQLYNNLQDYYNYVINLESINNLNKLCRERSNIIDNYLNFLNETKSATFVSNISIDYQIAKIHLYVPPGEWFRFFQEITFLRTFQSYYKKIQNEIDENIKNIKLQKEKRIYSKFGYKKSFFEIKSNMYNLFKNLNDFINYLKDYQDNYI